MTSNTFPVAALAVSAFLSILVTDAGAANRCDRGQLTRVEATACAKAAESTTALRQYVTRTRMIYGLQFADFARSPDQTADRVDRRLATR